MRGLSSTHLLIKDDSIHLNNILGLNFTASLPDSALIIRLKRLGIYVYQNGKRLKWKAAESESDFTSRSSMGFGMGLDYGGFGLKYSAFANKPVGVFIGVGHNTQQAGFNAGLDWKLNPMKRTTPYITMMYGYNAVLDLGGMEETYYGLSGGIGARARVGKKTNFLSLGILLRLTRSQELKEIMDTYKDELDYTPILLTFGFNSGF